ncbi:hypothetical protein [Branchiibius sp. NY16-3462-2]|uniref:hypothetical protein n=1 Tax=Branchiibius sp. NY16-3462-2 TaxID=1807500 RepID=UPI0025C4B7E7|nr:hypothetical protein [Branchiibius sp. NY16-3462-2]
MKWIVCYLIAGSLSSFLILRSSDSDLRPWLPIVFCATFYCCARRLLVLRGR